MTTPVQYKWCLSKHGNPYVVLRSTKTGDAASVMYFSCRRVRGKVITPGVGFRVYSHHGTRRAQVVRDFGEDIEAAFACARRALRGES